MASELPKTIIVVDLETTGGDRARDVILEIGAVALNDQFEELDAFTAVIGGWATDTLREDAVPVVQEMHDKNGLWEAVDESDCRIGTIAVRFAEWLDTFEKVDGKLALAGSGVLHFDRDFLNRDFPEAMKRFTYWGLDVGPMRRLARYALRDDLTLDEEAGKPHRALPDARHHADELRFYRSVYEASGRPVKAFDRWHAHKLGYD